MKLESRFILCYLGMAMVGTGSWLFHMTLKYEWQLADELPMIYCTAFALNCLLQAQRKSPSGKLVPFLLFLYCFGVTLIYLVNRNPVFHEVAYGLQVLFYTVYGAYVQKGVSKAKPHLHKNMVGIMSHAFFAFLLSFIVWNLDNMYCDTLREIRFRVHPVISPLFQFHALWHIGTGIGCYGAIVYQQMLRIVILDQDHMYSIKYFLGLIPYIADIRGELKQRKA
ncbi:alkaline ceramidase ydc1 [Mycoemilia scoparia]|uniref:Alkaline ceramidase ydc1 n=1 Tax=Mycoemilia scoparia TaxID=417184 RepID=A0A9W8DVX3_9FUNG|nr:alkaline ceramidase ydc1 [Mycoemilia scoparia]